MGKPHNWEETDSLLEKLRAKINMVETYDALAAMVQAL